MSRSSKLRRLPNGILVAPKRGAPPAIPEGYEVYNNDPFILVPKLPACQEREYREPDSRCCGNARYMFCNLFQKIVTRITCVNCEHSTG